MWWMKYSTTNDDETVMKLWVFVHLQSAVHRCMDSELVYD